VIVLGRPDKSLALKSLGTTTAGSRIAQVQLLGSAETVSWNQTAEQLVIDPPKAKLKSDLAVVFKVKFVAG